MFLLCFYKNNNLKSPIKKWEKDLNKRFPKDVESSTDMWKDTQHYQSLEKLK